MVLPPNARGRRAPDLEELPMTKEMQQARRDAAPDNDSPCSCGNAPKGSPCDCGPGCVCGPACPCAG